MPARNYIDVMVEEEKRLYRIMKELAKNGESKIEEVNWNEWGETLKKYGIRAKPFIKKGLLEPIWKTDYHTGYSNRLIRKTSAAEIIEERKGNAKSRFFIREKK